MPVPKHIKQRFDYNIKRVENLVTMFCDIEQSNGKNSHRKDLLRAAVVWLHATVEDVLRNLLKWKLPTADASYLNSLPIPNTQYSRKHKSQLGDLVAKYGDKKVSDILTVSIEAHLDRLNWSGTEQIAKTLESLKISPAPFKADLAALNELISRRHQIVHQSDREKSDDNSHGKVRTINKDDVDKWLEAVKAFFAKLLKEAEPKPRKKLAPDAV